MNKLEGILDWFLAMMNRDGETRHLVDKWINTAHMKAVFGEAMCQCDFHRATHTVIHLLSEKNKAGILEGTPWIHVAFWTQVDDFLVSTWPVAPDLRHTSLVTLCRSEGQRVIDENQLQVPDNMQGNATTSFAEFLSRLDGKLKTLSSHEDEDEDVYTDTSDEDSPSESDTDDEDNHNNSTDDEDMMNTDKNKGHMDNEVRAMPVGLEIHKDGITITPPPGTTYDQMIRVLQRQAAEEEQIIAIRERVDAFVLEGAVAFQAALKEEFGWVQTGEEQSSSMPSFLSMLTGGAPAARPVTTISVQTSLTTSEQVVWDQIRVPGVDGFIGPGFEFTDGRFFFLVIGEVKRKHEARVRKVIETTRRIAQERSIYKGHALEIDLPVDDRLDVLKHAPRFMKGLDAIDPRGMIFTRKLEEELETYVFNVIRNTELLAKLGISAHRGALFMGPPGTGKSLAAANTAKIAEQHGWTFFYLKKPDQIVPTYKLAASYGDATRGAILFVEDIDQAVMEGGEEDEVDEDVRKRFRELLNTLDGIDTKGAQVFVIFTTNKDPRRFDPTFTRESRLDSIINFTPPDEEAAERLLRWYLGDRLDPTTDLTAISAQLAGLRPASIKEVTAKATLGAARRLLATTDNLAGIINGNDLALAVGVSREQLELAKPLEKKEQPDSDEERAAVFLGKHIERAAELMSDRVSETVLRLARHQLGAEEKPALPDHQSNGHTTKALVEPTRTS